MVNIRIAEKQDVKSVVDLIYLAIKDIAFQLTGESSEDKMKQQLMHFYMHDNNRFSRRLIHVLENENGIAAMMLCYHGKEAQALYEPIVKHLYACHKDATTEIDNETDEDDYYIDAVAVYPDEQGKGYAKLMFTHAEQYAKEQGWHTMSLNVDIDNVRASRIYENMGYKPVKQISINEHPYIYMVKSIKTFV